MTTFKGCLGIIYRKNDNKLTDLQSRQYLILMSSQIVALLFNEDYNTREVDWEPLGQYSDRRINSLGKIFFFSFNE